MHRVNQISAHTEDEAPSRKRDESPREKYLSLVKNAITKESPKFQRFAFICQKRRRKREKKREGKEKKDESRDIILRNYESCAVARKKHES